MNARVVFRAFRRARCCYGGRVLAVVEPRLLEEDTTIRLGSPERLGALLVLVRQHEAVKDVAVRGGRVEVLIKVDGWFGRSWSMHGPVIKAITRLAEQVQGRIRWG